MEWNICVVSDCERCTPYYLNNALLYGSGVHWIPSQLSWNLLSSVFVLVLSGAVPRKFMFDTEFIRNFDNSDFKSHIKSIENWDEETACLFYNRYLHSKRDLNLIRELHQIYEKIKIPRDAVVCSISEMSRLNSDDPFRDRVEMARRRSHEVLSSLANKGISHAHASIINDTTFEIRSGETWSSHEAAQSLMNAMQRVLLPDVSELSPAQVRDLQEKAKDELEPMRAEMLLLTEDLRKMVDEDCDINNLAREAENLVAIRVEPSVRELSSRIRSDVRHFSRSTLVDATKAICLMGFGRIFQRSEYIEKGLIDFANAAAEKLPNLPTLKADTAASRFVIEIQQAMKNNS